MLLGLWPWMMLRVYAHCVWRQSSVRCLHALGCVWVIADEIRRIGKGWGQVGDQQSGDGPRANEPADEGVPRGSPASRDAGQDDSMRSSARGPSPADDDHASGGSPPDRVAAEQSMGRRLWKQLTGSRLRRGLAILSTAALTAAVTAIVGSLVSGWFDGGHPTRLIVVTPPASGPPIRDSALGCPTAAPYSPLLASVYHETSLDSPGLATVFPGKLNLSKADLQALDKQGSQNDAWLAGRGGYDGYATHIKLTLTGCQSLRILEMRAIILTQSPPLTGTIFQPGSQGSSGSVPLRFNLDSGSPVAMVLDYSGHLYNYFERNTITE